MIWQHRTRLGFHYALYVGVLVLTLFILALLFAHMLKVNAYADAINSLDSTARVVRNLMPVSVIEDPEEAEAFCVRAALESGTRVTLILPNGTVIGDSVADPELMDDHRTRPEVVVARSGEAGSAVRYSRTIGTDLVYVALPVVESERIAAIVRLSTPVADLRASLGNLYQRIAIFGLLVVTGAVILATFLSRSIRLPLRQLRIAAGEFSAGNLRYPLQPTGPIEIQELFEAAQSMAAEIDRRISESAERRGDLEMIVNSLQDAIIVVDDLLRIRWMNAPALAYVRAAPERLPTGAHLLALFRCSELHDAAQRVLTTRLSLRRTIQCFDEKEHEFDFYGTILPRTAEPDRPGEILIVLHDVFREKQIERIRRDFVANVSHELKTPLTLIKGAADTLGGLETGAPDPEATRFVSMISRHTDRIISIVDDLLSLARIESAERSELPRADLAIRELLASAVAPVAEVASAKRISITIDCREDLMFPGNQSLLTQAVVNLVENAVRYSDEETAVVVSAEVLSEGLSISVIDQGWGIPFGEQDRVFERFYRVDKGRGREAGGTGLGLAIVRHAALAHRGRVDLQSVPGEGSRFTVLIPEPIVTTESQTP